MGKMITPKFLSEETIKTVVDMVLDGFMFDSRMYNILTQKMCHIVVVVPSIDGERETNHGDCNTCSDHKITPHIIFEESFGDSINESLHDFRSIAHNKALQLWRGQNADGIQTRSHTCSLPAILHIGVA